MKDIDFLPEWYKTGRRRQAAIRTQWAALAGIFAVMIVWDFAAGRSISTAEGQVSAMARRQVELAGAAKKFNELRAEMKSLQDKARAMDQIDSRIDVASVLGELSYLVDARIVLRKVELMSEKFAEVQQTGSAGNRPVMVRAAGVKPNDQKAAPVGAVRFKIVVSGVAADSSDVATLIRKLEDSAYFFQVVPGFSRYIDLPGHVLDGEPQAAGHQARNEPAKAVDRGSKSIRVADFEISCYLANYREQ